VIYFVELRNDPDTNSSDTFVKPSAASGDLTRGAPASLRSAWAGSPLEKKTPDPYEVYNGFRWWGWASSADDAEMQARQAWAGLL
jgi:hypothetical protein